MFFKSCVYKPFGKCRNSAYKPNLYDYEQYNPFEEINTPQKYLDFLKEQNAHLYDNLDLNDEDIAKDDILEYILKEYS